MRLIPFAATLAVALSIDTATAQDNITGRARVVDGDTIEIHGLSIRLRGVDTPERYQRCRDAAGRSYRCGDAATRALRRIIGAGPVRCDLLRERDRYGRAIGICWSGGRELNRWLVRQGLGLAYRRYDRRNVADEEAARREGVGMHAGPYIAPWDWRRGKRLR